MSKESLFSLKSRKNIVEIRLYWKMGFDYHQFCVLMLMRKDGISADSSHSSSLNNKLT